MRILVVSSYPPRHCGIGAYASGQVARLRAGGHDVTVLGNAGRDTISGTRGRDLLIGGPGRDTINGNANRDRCSGEKLKSCEVRLR